MTALSRAFDPRPVACVIHMCKGTPLYVTRLGDVCDVKRTMRTDSLEPGFRSTPWGVFDSDVQSGSFVRDVTRGCVRRDSFVHGVNC